MLIIKPYGRTETRFDASGRLRREIRRKSVSTDISEFVKTHPELVIAQWISVIDKIATKPRGNGKPTAEQRELRNAIGRAAWLHLKKNTNLLNGLDDSRQSKLQKLWEFKIAPYPKENIQNGIQRARGKWYKRFADETDPKKIDDRSAENIVKKIDEHLNRAQYRICRTRPNKVGGHVAARAESISGNVPKPQEAVAGGEWSDVDIDRYFAEGDVAGKILKAAEERENGSKPWRVGPDVAAKELYAHWAKLFLDKNGKVLSIAEARKTMPGPFHLHCAVRDAYSRILKRHKKGRGKNPRGERTRVSVVLPATRDKLLKLVKSMGSNREVNRLIRLGKIIHYSAAGESADSPQNVVDNWPSDLSGSPYLTSSGQAEIKGNEAFMRIWRHVLVLANRTLHHWVDPDDDINGDIFTGGAWGNAMQKLQPDKFQSKAKLLLGSRADLFSDPANSCSQREVLNSVRDHAAQLRNSSFHFKGLDGFLKALEVNDDDVGERVKKALEALYERDLCERTGRLLETMRGAHMDRFFEKTLNERLFATLSDTDAGAIALPRFARVLKRWKNAWKGKENSLHLIEPPNRNALRKPARLCAYTALKLLYERPFRRWFEYLESDRLGEHIKKAKVRASREARSINAKGDEDRRAVIEARAAKIALSAKDMTVEEFFFILSAETASEMRVQRYYESDPEAARKQAKYIEDFKCDVIALAFADYLKKEKFESIIKLPENETLPDSPKCRLDDLAGNGSQCAASPPVWQLRLYFLLHLVPADAASSLLHQLRKWKNLSNCLDQVQGPRAEPERILLETFVLYLDMHDAKFEGSGGIIGAEKLRCLFDDEQVFDKVFPGQPGQEEKLLLPYRGLREVLRFGGLGPLKSVFMKHSVASAEVDEVMKAETGEAGASPIAKSQEKREKLHAQWVKTRSKGGFSDEDKDNYRKALDQVVRHRHLSAHIRLVNHSRLNGLLMRILGRLVDYAGLWERDLYFVTLALIRELRNSTPEHVFNQTGIENFNQGRIIEVLRNLCGSDLELCDKLKKLFNLDDDFLSGTATRIRNELMHFNMLRGGGTSAGNGQEAPNLTKLVNRTRKLMEYDRKLKNSVSRSIVELVAKEGVELTWGMRNHLLSDAKVVARRITHLSVPEIEETLHGEKFVEMVADLFDGTATRHNHANRGNDGKRGGIQKPATGRKKRSNRRGRR